MMEQVGILPLPLVLLLITLVSLVDFSSATFNLYMNTTETKRILGIDGDLYYVRNNVINDYALGFNVPIRPDIEDLYFSWQHKPVSESIHSKPKNEIMQYNLSVSVTNEAAMKPPEFNIERRGTVPKNPRVFRVLLRCTYVSTAEINVVITLNVTMFNNTHPTSLQLRRKKTCVKDEKRAVLDYGMGGKTSDMPVDNTNEEIKTKSFFGAQTTSTTIFYVAISVACGVIVLIVICVIVWYCRAQKHNNERLSDTSSSALTAKSQYTKVDTPNTSVVGMPVAPMMHQQQTQPLHSQQYQMAMPGFGGGSMASGPVSLVQNPALRRPLSPFMELTPEDTDTIIHEMQIDRKKLSLGEILNEGTFGKIYRGTMLIERESEIGEIRTSEMEVYVKTVTDAASPNQIDTMLREGCALQGQMHANINTVIASCLENIQPPMLLYQFLNEGNLKKFLQRSKISDYGTHQNLNTQDLVYMATQIVRGVQFLHRKRILHRDIATRNCVVDSNLIVRVADRGLSRDLFPGDYHCLGDNDNRPVKWMSIEALLDRQYSYASDVWSYGVTLWEILSLGQQPYVDVDPFEMATYLKEGYRVSQPLNCPDELFAVMACCWALNPDERPTMSQLQVCMQDFYTALSRFI